MTEVQQAAQDMRREVLKQCLWCGSAANMENPDMWDPTYPTERCWPVGMCEVCHDASCPQMSLV